MQREKEGRLRLGKIGKTIDVIAGEKSRLERSIEISRRRLQALEMGIAAARMRDEELAEEALLQIETFRKKLREKQARFDDLTFQIDYLRGCMSALVTTSEWTEQKRGVYWRQDSERFAALSDEFDQIACRIERFLNTLSK